MSFTPKSPDDLSPNWTPDLPTLRAKVQEARRIFNQAAHGADTVYDADVQDLLSDVIAAVRALTLAEAQDAVRKLLDPYCAPKSAVDALDTLTTLAGEGP